MHRLLTDQPGQQMLLLGNDAIARGAIEAGVAVASTYPGTPSSEISLNFFQISKESDLYFEYSVNEKVALEVAAAAANCGIRSMCVMKHVGLNVASDVLATLAYVGVRGGLVILSADDPLMFSSQNEQDNRYYGKLTGLPVLEPSSVEEAKEMMPYAFDLSEELQEPVIFRTTTRINHSNATIKLGEIRQPETQGVFKKDPDNLVCVPAVSRKLHVKLLENFEKARNLANASPYNYTRGSGPWGIVCNGVSFHYVADAVKDLGVEDKVRILRIGFSHPMPDGLVKDFLKECEKVLIVEEGEPVMEETVKAMAQEEELCLPIKGKDSDLFSRLYEYDPAMVRDCIARYFDLPYTPAAPLDLSDMPEIPQRPPTLCAGCSHRSTYYAVKKAAEGMDTIYPSDIGCYTLGYLPPLSMADFVVCMGASVGTSCGFSAATDQKVISFIGDSTFFHTGVPGLMNAVFNKHNFTLVILDNRTTAMTGHQPNPGVDMQELKFEGYGRIQLEKLVKAIGVPHVSVVNPYNIKKSIATFKEALDFKGVSVVISKKKCTLYAKNLKQLKDRAFYISDKCRNHRDCINEIACPAFFINGDKVEIDPDMCVGCSTCMQICPEKAIRPLKQKQ
ncbi:MAG: indolepyruvate ferredoxin oxidoreductase subunit alpha [Proteobacteria bacterium]|nr:indolepyruvate ferredoxin oxidoreductase subunit alpha [Pseudomonadota bacterium]